MARLYISQKRIDIWSGENRIDIRGDVMTLVEHGRDFRVEPAARFLAVSGGGDDPHDLLGKVKSARELEQMGADLMADSVIYTDTAYDVEEGFIGEPLQGDEDPATVEPPQP
ncbi:hypothetical protein [Haliangium sp.]|uniref:hypothetical protein n=1 Tax=Haliangium sp. TaxID=2663208 RepID=UPI003D10D395